MSVGDTHSHCATGGDDGLVMLHELEQGLLVNVFRGHGGAVTGVAILEQKRMEDSLVVSVSLDSTLRMWHMKSGDLLSTFTPTGQSSLCEL